MDAAEWGGLGLGAAFAGMGLALLVLPWRLRQRGRQAEGVVESVDDDGRAVVRFRTTEGDVRHLSSPVDDVAGALEPGHPVPIVYDPADPDQAVPAVVLAIRRAFGALFLLTGGLILLMVVAFVTGVF
ncbi:MAG TPA: DUF3592 domain-containing protein [Acidimicrobiales bacterium]